MSVGTTNSSGSPVSIDRSDEAGNATFGTCTTANLPSAASGYAVGCLLLDKTTGATYRNTGSTASCTFTLAPGAGSELTFTATTTNTTAVNVIGTTNGIAGTVTAVYLISLDTTAANITVAGTAGTIATIAKGTSAGVFVGGTSLTNASITASGTLTIVSSVAPAGGNAQVIVLVSA